MLSIEEKEILIAAYERQFPEYGANMDKVLTDFKDDGLHIHILNIKVLAYTANEPYRTLYLSNVGEVKIQELDYSGNPKFIRGDFESGGGVYINVTNIKYDDTGKVHARVYNKFFHETSHAIDYSVGLRYKDGGDNYFTSQYVDDKEISMSDTLETEVRKRVDDSIKKYFESTIYVPQDVRDDISESVRDAIFNQIDYDSYGKPDFNNKYSDMASLCYDEVCNDLNSQLYGTNGDIYGSFTGNTLSGNITAENHPAIRRETGAKDEFGNKEYKYGFYWIDEDYSEIEKNKQTDIYELTVKTDNGEVFVETKSLDDKNLKAGDNYAEKIIYSDGNLEYNDNSGTEFFAEAMAANMTREGGTEKKAMEFYSADTNKYFNEMVDVMKGVK